MDATQRTATEPEPDSGRPARFWISLAALSAVILIYIVLVNSRGSQSTGLTGPAIGRSLGYLELQPLVGEAKPAALADLHGHVSLLNFWGTWCPPCIRELPEIVGLAERYAARDAFRLYAVSCGQGDDRDLALLRAETEAFLAARNVELPIYADESAVTRRALSLSLAVPLGYPMTIVLDRSGKIRGFWQGYDSRAARDMARLIDQLLADDD